MDKGQIEAAKSIGMNGFQRMRLIVAPQAFKIVVPSLGNEFVTLIKETAGGTDPRRQRGFCFLSARAAEEVYQIGRAHV